jgi:hypothetical protein
MEYKDFEYHLVQTHDPYGWKWTVFVAETRTRTGRSLTRADAVLDAESEIDKLLKPSDSRRPTRNEPENPA